MSQKEVLEEMLEFIQNIRPFLGYEKTSTINKLADKLIAKAKAVLLCELCNGTGYLKSNTLEYEGNCPNCTERP